MIGRRGAKIANRCQTSIEFGSAAKFGNRQKKSALRGLQQKRAELSARRCPAKSCCRAIVFAEIRLAGKFGHDNRFNYQRQELAKLAAARQLITVIDHRGQVTITTTIVMPIVGGPGLLVLFRWPV